MPVGPVLDRKLLRNLCFRYGHRMHRGTILERDCMRNQRQHFGLQHAGQLLRFINMRLLGLVLVQRRMLELAAVNRRNNLFFRTVLERNIMRQFLIHVRIRSGLRQRLLRERGVGRLVPRGLRVVYAPSLNNHNNLFFRAVLERVCVRLV